MDWATVMKSFSTLTLFTFNNTNQELLDVPWPKLQEQVGEARFRFLLDHPECEVYLEHDDHLLGFPTSRVMVNFLTQDSQMEFERIHSDK